MISTSLQGDRNRIASFVSALALIIVAVASAKGQSSKPCYDRIYEVTDVLPVVATTVDKVVAALENEIAIPDSLKNRKGYVFISYVITCTGDVTKLKLIKKGDWDGTIRYEPFEILVPQIKKIIIRELKYKAALQGGKAVDFFQILSVSFESGRIFLSLN